MENKFTPGPWKYSRTHERSLNYWYVITDAKGYGPIVDVGGYDLSGQIAEAKHLITDQGEIEANARLIAVAPEMFEDLEMVERLLDGPIADLLTGDSMADTGAYDALNLIRGTIAKAKGDLPNG